ncbi:MAG TPA: SLC13 family permease [Thermoanaerobaculia bacterium]
MDPHLIATFVILGAALALLLSDRVRADLVALLVVLALGATGVLTSQEAFSGLSRSAVVILFAIFILAEGLERTGVSEKVGRLLVRLAGPRESRLVLAVMSAGALLSLVMNNIAAAAVLMPASTGAARRSGIKASRLLMPLAFATLLGGMATLLTTTNIVVSSLLSDHGLEGFGLLAFAPLGLPLALLGIAYVTLWGRRLLPEISPGEELAAMHRKEDDLAAVYQLGETVFRAGVPAGSALVGRTLAASGVRSAFGLDVLAVERDGRLLLAPAPETVLAPDDILMLSGRPDERSLADARDLEVLPGRAVRHESDLESATVVVVEAVLAPRSDLLGRTLTEAHFRERHGMTVLALWRAGRPISTGLSQTELQFGDALLLQGPRDRLAVLRAEPDLILLNKGEEDETPVHGKSGLALAILGVTLALAAWGRLPVAEVMLGGALAMVICRVLSMDQAYQTIDWRSLFLVAGMLPLGIAMTKTGAAALLTDGLVSTLGPAGPRVLLAGLVVATVLLAQAIHSAAVAAVVAPIAIAAGQRIGGDPRAFAMGVALASSMAFLTPLGHPVNILVMGPGGYRFKDYLRVGLPLTVLLIVVIVAFLPVVWPLKP